MTATSGDHPVRTLLGFLLFERRWTTDDFRRHYARAARSVPDTPAVTISERQAKRWLSGRLTTRPYPAACRVLEMMFERSIEELMAPHEPAGAPAPTHETRRQHQTAAPPVRQEDRMSPSPLPPPERQDAPRRSEAVAAAADADDAFRFLVRAQNTTSPEILTLLWNETRRLARTYGTQLTWLVDDLVVARKAIFRLLEEPGHPGQTRDLYFLGGLVCAMLAHTCRDLGRVDGSLRYQDTALLCADRADHPGLRIVVRTEQAATAYWMGLHSQSAQYAQLAADDAAHVRGSIAVLPAVQEARAWAALGHTDLTRAALNAARDSRETVTSDDLDEIGGMMSFALPEQLGIVAGTAAWLPDPAEAERAAYEAVSVLEAADPANSSVNSTAIARADLALARVRRRDLDGARAALRPILHLPQERRVLPIRASVQRLHHALANPVFDGSRAAHDAIAEIEAFSQTPQSAQLPE